MSDLACKESNLSGQHPLGFVQSPDANNPPLPTPHPPKRSGHHSFSPPSCLVIIGTLCHKPIAWTSCVALRVRLFLMGGRYGFRGSTHATGCRGICTPWEYPATAGSDFRAALSGSLPPLKLATHQNGGPFLAPSNPPPHFQIKMAAGGMRESQRPRQTLTDPRYL